MMNARDDRITKLSTSAATGLLRFSSAFKSA